MSQEDRYSEMADDEIVDELHAHPVTRVMETTGDRVDLSDLGEKIEDAQDHVGDDVSRVLQKTKLHLLENRAVDAYMSMGEALDVADDE